MYLIIAFVVLVERCIASARFDVHFLRVRPAITPRRVGRSRR